MAKENLEIQGMNVDFEQVTGYKVDIWDSVLTCLLGEILKEKVGFDFDVTPAYDEDNGHLDGFKLNEYDDGLNEEQIEAMEENIDDEVDWESDYDYPRSLRDLLFEYIFGDSKVKTYSSDAFSGRGDVEFTFFLTEDQFNHLKKIGLK